MKKNLKVLYLCIMAALLIAVLVSCNTNKGDEKGNETSAPTESQDAEPTAEPTEAPYDPTTDPKVFQDELPRVTGSSTTHISIKANYDTGYDVYAPVEGEWGYRYAPSIIYYPDGSMDAWFSTSGLSGEMDWIVYMHSEDGTTWTNEKICLQPTPDSYDACSVCDASAIYFGGYYYLGYTSTIDTSNRGVNNNVFIARSKNPDGPYEKWNGSGWGGDPVPVIYYDENNTKYGAGEPTFVELDGKIYMYYTWMGDVSVKYVAVGDSTDENWPATLVDKGRAFTGLGDQVEAFYVEDIGKFCVVQVNNRFTNTSGVQILESVDGIHFITGEFTSLNIAKFCHNMGIAKRSNGHIQLKDNHMIGYAYASGGSDSEYWGKWPTRFVKVDITSYEGDVDKSDKGRNGVLISDYYWDRPENPTPIGVTTTPHVVKLNVGTTSDKLKVYWVDSTIKRYEVTDASLLKFYDYDTSLISFDGTKIIGLKEGKTNVTVEYEGYTVTFKVYVYAEGFEYDQEDPEIVSVRAVEEELTVYFGKANGGTHQKQIRMYVEYSDGTWGEEFTATYTSTDRTIARADSSGIITAASVGDCVITGEIEGHTFTCTVHVVEAPAELTWKEKDYK